MFIEILVADFDSLKKLQENNSMKSNSDEMTLLNSRYFANLFFQKHAAYFFLPNQRIVKHTGDNDKEHVNLEKLSSRNT